MVCSPIVRAIHGCQAIAEMDGNRDEAERCIDIALDALGSLNFQRAQKFLRKAESLYPTQKAKGEPSLQLSRFRNRFLKRHFRIADLLDQIQEAHESSSSSESTARRRQNATASKEKANTSVEAEYSKDQLEMCSRIKKCKDYYEVLSVTKEATDTEIKKAYKKLALQLHPDKNRAPGAVEAFKTLGNAAGVLTDPEKRKNYDLYGDKGRKVNSRHQYQTNHEYEHMYRGADSSFESDFTAEELFNMFFGNGFPQQRNTQTSRRYQNRYEPVITKPWQYT